MTDLLRLASEAGKRTSPTLSKLSENDIESIWTGVSAYTEKQLTIKKGVHLTGLGTFTFSKQKLDIGNKFIMMQRPVFLLAGKLSHSLGLKPERLPAAVSQPVVQLNFTAVSQETPFSREVVEGCVRETLRILVGSLASGQNVFLTFKGIGVLSFRKNQVRMKFKRDFINAMDGGGRPLLAFNNNRPGSSASLVPGAPPGLQRPQTAHHITLPTFCSLLPENKDARSKSAAPVQKNARGKGEVPKQREPKSPQTSKPAYMKAVSLSEEPNPNRPMDVTDRTTTSISPPEVPPKHVSCSDHARAGQELCYLCVQRARRNAPVYLREQQEAEEKAQERLLLLKEQQQDEQYMKEEQAKLNELREHAKQVAAFNLQMSEKKEKPYSVLYPTSFIFPARPLTPARGTKQHRYMAELQSQIERRRQREARDQQNRLLVERLDQIQLVQEIALQKAQQLQQKRERIQHYRTALDTQLEDKKGADPPDPQPDTSRFSRCDTLACNAESQERAQKLFQVNVSAATQRKKEEERSRQAQLEEERRMLKHNRTELILDHVHRFEKRLEISKSLENEWSRSARLKRQREEEERRFIRSAGELLVDKLAQHKRCYQCKRRTSNCGQTNIWKDSFYQAGSQFMI